MHMTRLSQARRIFSGFAAAIGLLLLAGCNLTITNLTSDVLRENPSQLYTITARVTPTSRDLDRSSLQVSVVIDGQNQPMQKSAGTSDVYEYDYPLPRGRDEAAYYFLVRYRFNSRHAGRDVRGILGDLPLQGRAPLCAAARGQPRPGRRAGRASPAAASPRRTSSTSTPPRRARVSNPRVRSASSFPPSSPTALYNVAISGGGSTLSVGTFRADATGATVTPSSLTLRTGEHQTLAFTIPNPAPQGGLLLDVTTDIPESVIMPEVVVPEGCDQRRRSPSRAASRAPAPFI